MRDIFFRNNDPRFGCINVSHAHELKFSTTTTTSAIPIVIVHCILFDSSRDLNAPVSLIWGSKPVSPVALVSFISRSSSESE